MSSPEGVTLDERAKRALKQNNCKSFWDRRVRTNVPKLVKVLSQRKDPAGGAISARSSYAGRAMAGQRLIMGVLVSLCQTVAERA